MLGYFDTLDYLKKGNAKQQAAYDVLTNHQVFENLKSFDPILVGTIPINIDIEESDLDIICYYKQADEFKSAVVNLFKDTNGFQIKEIFINNQQTLIANFTLDGFPVEIFGQTIPTKEQVAYRHMIIEHKLLQEKGEIFRQQISRLEKRSGYKTEPAFAKLLSTKW